MLVGDWLAKRELLTPDKIALIDAATGERRTYRQWNARANAVAHLLRERLGVQKGDRVAVLAANSPEYLDLLFAAGKLGAILVPLNWRLTVRELEIILRDCAPAVLFHDDAYAENARSDAGRPAADSLHLRHDGQPQGRAAFAPHDYLELHQHRSKLGLVGH